MKILGVETRNSLRAAFPEAKNGRNVFGVQGYCRETFVFCHIGNRPIRLAPWNERFSNPDRIVKTMS